MKGQMNLFPEEYIKDSDCTKDTPVVHGKPDTPIYGMGARIKPRVPGRQDTEHFKSIYLDSLLPLEEYDLIAILLSGGKDSIACYYKLLEMGVPKERIEFWHHDIDGGHPSRRMDWRCTQNYVKAFAEAENVLGFTLDNKCNLDEFVGDTESCVYHGNKEAIRSLITGEFTTDDIYVKGDWLYPAGAFHGAEGGPC